MHQQRTLFPLTTEEERTCSVCSKELIRREGEPSGNFRKRKVCSRECKSIAHARFWEERRRAYLVAGEKRCTRCDRVKPLRAFRRSYAHPNAYEAACIDCQSDKWAKYCAKNHEQLLEKWRLYRERNRERINAGFRTARADTPADIRQAYNRILNHAPDRKHYIQRYCETHKDKKAACSRRWRKENPERNTENSERYRARKIGASYVERIDRLLLIDRLGSVCYLCDKVLERCDVALDHVVPLSRGGEHSEQNLRPCCQPCNSRKGARLWSELEDVYPDMAQRIRSHIT